MARGLLGRVRPREREMRCLVAYHRAKLVPVVQFAKIQTTSGRSVVYAPLKP